MPRLFLHLFFAALTAFFAYGASPEQPPRTSIIPQPLELVETAGSFVFDANTPICIPADNPEVGALASLLAEGILAQTGLSLKTIETADAAATGPAIYLILRTDAELGKEGYRLRVDENGIFAEAPASNGLFYAIQTILQLIPATPSGEQAVAVPAVIIKDNPRFGWRGMMLDTGRCFYPVDFIKKFIDAMAMHKLNVFHWHLTDDHGWRIEIKKYPALTSTSAWRKGTNFQRGNFVDRNPHGGYYTQEQIRDIVDYARARYITILPEIEMPGHALSALVAYPELSCTGGPFEIPDNWGIQKDIYCAGKESVFIFLEDVLSEVMELFPGEFIHIGGDEAPKDRWEKCPDCQRRIRDEGLKDEAQLQSYFVNRIERFVNSKGKRIIGWDEILEDGLSPSAAVMVWRNTEAGRKGVRKGHPVVMTTKTHLYFDYAQGEPHLAPHMVTVYNTPLRKTYAYEPVPSGITDEQAALITGVQANLWSEYINSEDRCEYMVFPRASALAEVAWTTPARKNWDDFLRRLQAQYLRYEAKGIHFSDAAFQVYFRIKNDVAKRTSVVALKTDSYQPQIRYTLDGSVPVAASPLYESSLTLPEHTIVRAATFKDGKRISPVNTRAIVFFDTPATPDKRDK